MKLKHSQACLEAHEGVGSDEGFSCSDNCAFVSASEHTPGPWTHGSASKDNGETGFTGILKLGAVGFKLVAKAENEADARLIASAPELLEALKDLVARFPEGPIEGTFSANARRVIAKAEGR